MTVPSKSRPSWHGYRWWIVALLFLATTVNYVDRQVVALLKDHITAALSWTKDNAEWNYGLVTASFQAMYALGYLFGGRLMDVIGLKRGYTLCVTIWSLAAAATGYMFSTVSMCAARAALGLAEGGNFPAAVKTVSEWFPKRERALATGIFNAGSNLGPLITPLMVAWLVEIVGWRMTFVATGLIGFTFVVLWLAVYQHPHQHKHVSETELSHIRSDPPDPEVRIPWGRLLDYRATWAFIAGMGLTAPFWWFYLFWAPDFFKKTYAMDLKTVGLPLVTIYLLADVGSVGAGWLSSHLVAKGREVGFARKVAFATCALCVIPVVFAPYVSNAWAAVGLIGLAAAAHQGFSANLYTLVSDNMPRYAVSSIVGMGGFTGSCVGLVFSLFVGKVLQATHSYHIMFLLAPFAYLGSATIIHSLLPKFEQVEIR